MRATNRDMNQASCVVKQKANPHALEPNGLGLVLRSSHREELLLNKPGKDRVNPHNIAKRDERDALETVVNTLDGTERVEGEQRPEALAQFAKSARKGEKSPKENTADKETAPRPTANRDKHEVAERLLHKGAKGETPDPQEEGADRLPDRIIDRG